MSTTVGEASRKWRCRPLRTTESKPASLSFAVSTSPASARVGAPAPGRARRELVDEHLPARLPENDRDERGGVDNHTPCGPNPRIRSRSRLLILRPSVLRGTWGQTSVSRKRTKLARRSRAPPQTASRALRSWSATLTARVLLSPASAATSAASRSVSRSLMFNATVASMVEINRNGTMSPIVAPDAQCHDDFTTVTTVARFRRHAPHARWRRRSGGRGPPGAVDNGPLFEHPGAAPHWARRPARGAQPEE